MLPSLCRTTRILILIFETITQARAINVDLCLENLGPENLVMHMVSLLTGMASATYLTNMLYKIDRPLRGHGFHCQGNR